MLENDAEANAESGFPELIGYLRKRVLGQADRLARRGVVHDVLAVTEQLVGNLRAEQSAQQNPEEVQRLVRTLTEAQERATALKERSARWQQTLNDGVADLNADIDYDLRDRMREISRMAEEELLAGGDPAKVWDQFAGWVQQEVASAASANFIWATQRARWLAHQVAEHFAGDRDQLLPALRNDPSDALRSVRAIAAPDDSAVGPGQQGADRAARRLHGHADVRDDRHLRRVRLADQPAGHRRRGGDGRQEHRRRAQADRSPSGRTRPRPRSAATSTT